LFDRQLQVYGTPPDDRFRSALRADVQGVFERGQSFFGVYQMGRSRQEVFIEWYPPPPCLVLVGAGNDAQITAQMATLLGWKVVVADGRPTHANRQRFGGECQVIVARPEKVLENIHVGPQTAFVLMTHNFPYDLAVFRLLCQLPETPYIGILGPQKRFQKMLDAYAPPPHILQKVFAPVGLHLGAENAAEIALSILAEILAVMRKTGGGHLRAKSGPIHDRAGLDFQVKQI
jgi:xanthine/CO dehydrogenase XdhC/CoxF family maturation factor